MDLTENDRGVLHRDSDSSLNEGEALDAVLAERLRPLEGGACAFDVEIDGGTSSRRRVRTRSGSERSRERSLDGSLAVANEESQQSSDEYQVRILMGP